MDGRTAKEILNRLRLTVLEVRRIVQGEGADVERARRPCSILWDSRAGQFMIVTSFGVYLIILYRRNMKIIVNAIAVADGVGEDGDRLFSDKARVARALDYDHWHECDGEDIAITYDRSENEIAACIDLKIAGAQFVDRLDEICGRVRDLLRSTLRYSARTDSGFDRWLLINRYPESYLKVDWKSFDGESICLILNNRPELAVYCEMYCDWSKLTARHWLQLIDCDPKYAARCNWRLFDDYDWIELLRSHPEFHERPEFGANFDFSKFGHAGSSRREGRPSAVYELLKMFPEHVADVCLDEVSGDEWMDLCLETYLLIGSCDWRKLSYDNLKALEEGEVADLPTECRWEQVRFDEQNGLSKFINDFPSWRSFYKGDKVIDATSAKEITVEAIGRALSEGWKIKGDAWKDLLLRDHTCDSICDWTALTAEDWTDVLKVRPELDVHLPLDMASNVHWVSVVIEQPNLLKSEHCRINLDEVAEETKKVLKDRCPEIFKGTKMKGAVEQCQ